MANEYTEQLAQPQIDEVRVMSAVAQQYELTPEETRLLFAIRKAENGGPGREFGVLNPEAMRYKDDPAKSFTIQAQWAAGTIKKRYKGDLEEFAKRWAPIGAKNDPQGLNRNWLKNVQYYMNKMMEMPYGNDRQ